jgi:TrmH family RNA methyltransferase
VASPALANVAIVLDEPQNLINIAAVVRAMKNMGLRRLRLVRPAEFDAWRVEGIAHRADDLIGAVQVFDTLEAAVGDCELVYGTSARARTARRNYGRPRDVAEVLVAHALQGPVAIVFGREDRGLANDALDLCDGVIVIPTNPAYSSMNLAQACLLICYELFLAAEGGARPLPRGKKATDPATRSEMEAMLGALEKGMTRIDFFKAREPANVMRTFRTLFARAALERREAALVKAFGFEIGNYIDRAESARGASGAAGE